MGNSLNFRATYLWEVAKVRNKMHTRYFVEVIVAWKTQPNHEQQNDVRSVQPLAFLILSQSENHDKFRCHP